MRRLNQALNFDWKWRFKTVERVSCVHGAYNITLEKDALDKDLPL